MTRKKKINEKELKALVSLLDDDDQDVISHVEEKIHSLGIDIIPYLEDHWETEGPSLEIWLELHRLFQCSGRSYGTDSRMVSGDTGVTVEVLRRQYRAGLDEHPAMEGVKGS